jgi:hypothetical protein
MMKFGLLPALALAFWLCIPSVLAQGSGSTNIADRVSRIILPDPSALNSPITSPFGGVRPTRSERPDFPPELKQRLRSFESLRELYLAQEELRKKLRTATTDQDRERLRAQLQVLRDEWLDKSRALKEETRTRLEELKGELSPKYREALDEARQRALDAAAEHKRPRDER